MTRYGDERMTSVDDQGADHLLALRRKALEECFFRCRNPELTRQLRDEAIREAKRIEFRRASGITDQKLLPRLIGLKLDIATVAALVQVPLVRVAWADGQLDDRERDAIIAAAAESGLDRDSASYHWLVSWLQSKPDGELSRCWQE
jgi:hypothetical protein